LQPLFAAIIAISLGKDHLNSVKIVAAVLIFTGVYLVTQKKPSTDN
jgi:drug/metabolite transporter (DMT)-like permease